MPTIAELVSNITDVDREAMDQAGRRQDSLTKPRGSLGKLEELSVRLAGIYRTSRPSIARKAVFTMAADHGVTAEGVSAYPSAVTAQMVLNFARGGAAINVLSRFAGAEVTIVDMGVASALDWPECVARCSKGSGTRNMARGPAMTRTEAESAVTRGAELALKAIDNGVNAVAVGDMGIGNTTAASAVASAVTRRPVSSVTGRGTGIDDASLGKKIRAIERALEVNSVDASDGIDVLSKVGGFEIAGMVGVMLGAASRSIPVFLDGFVSGSAALVAGIVCPKSKEYMIAAHLSAEPGHKYVLEHLGLVPLLDLNMRLGEGTGAVLAFLIADAACRILNEMATFEDAGVSQSAKEIL